MWPPGPDLRLFVVKRWPVKRCGYSRGDRVQSGIHRTGHEPAA